MTTVALIEDDTAFREGIERLLTSSRRYHVAGSFGSTEEALRVLPRYPVQLALIDINLPGQPGPAAVLRLRESCPATRCAVLTIFEDADNLFGALQAGAAGYLLKSDSPEQILAGLDELIAGGAPMSRAVARRVLETFSRPVSTADCEEVTPREREILDLLARGLTYKEIAGRLGLSPPTVKNHLARIYPKLAVRSRTEAVVKWLSR